MNSQEAALLRAELLGVTQNWQSEDKPTQATDIFFPTAHVRALALDRPLLAQDLGVVNSESDYDAAGITVAKLLDEWL